MSIKSTVSSILRKLHLLRAAEYGRFLFHKIKFRRHNNSFIKKHPEIVLPPDYLIYETYKLNFEEYYYDGFATAKEIIAEVHEFVNIEASDVNVLDWGCGPGRIMRHLPLLLPKAIIYGTDYNNVYVQWCSKNLKNINVSNNNIDPPLNYKNSFFDLVISISIFTHLSAQNHIAWMDELKRILKPGAVAFITTQGQSYRSKLLPAEQAKFDKGELVTREAIKEGNRLFSAFHPQAFIKQLIQNKFDIVKIIEGHLNGDVSQQDIWVIKKCLHA